MDPESWAWEIDQKTEVSADVWMENTPLTCCEEGWGNGGRRLGDDQTQWGYRKRAETES